MKILLTFITLLYAFSAPLFAQTPGSQQTPDVAEVPEPAQDPQQDEAPKALSQRDKDLIQSSYDGELAHVEVLIMKGATVNSQDQKKRTPLILASSNGHLAVVEFLVSKGAEVNLEDSDRQTALMYASKRSFNEIAAFLLKNGAEVNGQSKKKGMTALMLAAGWDNVELVRMLLEHGADPSLTDIFGNTAKVFAEEMGNTDVLDMLPDPAVQGATNP
jgi:ankyrin repeat protein